MKQDFVRVYIGNLPSDASEEGISKFFKKYACVSAVEIKTRADGFYAFVNLKDLKSDLETCIKKLSVKTWNGHQLLIQPARESFLQRLERERLENQKNIKKSDDNTTEKNVKKIYDNSSENNINSINNDDSGFQNGKHFVGISNETDEDSSDSDVPTRGQLPMFRGTKRLPEKKMEVENLKKITKNSSDFKTNKISSHKIHEEKEVLEKFEMFNGVWKDEPSTEYPQNHKESRRKINVQNFSSDTRIPNKNFKTHNECSDDKHEEAEKRRKEAVELRKKEFIERKQFIKHALASLDSVDNSRPNKKIVFGDDDFALEEEGNHTRNYDHKLTLFSDDEMVDEKCNDDDFRIRSHFQGRKGQSLLALQARYGIDQRFTLDERFIESEDDEEKDSKTEDPDNISTERQKVLHILGNLLEKDVFVSDKPKKTSNLMLRYDPTKPDHEKYVIKPGPEKSQKDSEKTKKKTSFTKEVKTIEEMDEEPVVSKERYYQVSDTLVESLKNKDQKFSLLDMFGDVNENEGEKVEFDPKPIMQKRKELSLNPFNDDPVSIEDESYLKEEIPEDLDDQYNVGVKQEGLFFRKNDPRFMEGLAFIASINKEYVENFAKRRRELAKITKHKVLNCKRKIGKWSQKGGRWKTQSSKTFKKRKNH